MKFVCSFVRTGIFALLVALTSSPELCVGKSGIDERNSREINRSLSSPQTQSCSHRANNLWMTVTNWGCLGSQFGYHQLKELDCFGLDVPFESLAPSAEFPGGSGINYLYIGALWIGAVVDNDTLVSVGFNGWITSYEIYPGVAPNGSITRISNRPSDQNFDPSALSDLDMIAVCFDTLTASEWVTLDPVDNRPHLPLGLKIVQESYSWSDSTYEDFIIFRYRIRNIGSHYLNKVFFGLYFDCDIWHPSTGNGFTDDISGSYRCFDQTASESVFVAWSADSDGDPSRAGQWYEGSARGVIGVTLLDFPTNPQQSFNWWFSNGDAVIDWGPRRQDNNRDFGTGGLGTPSGDHNKYYVLSTPEKDYDQLWERVDHSSLGWLPPLPGIILHWENYDTRFLLSFGGIDLAPGDSTEFSFAVVMGENFHRNPTDFQELYDAAHPQAFYDSLDFSDLTTNILAARQLYRQEFNVVSGDVDRSGAVTVADAISLLNYLYLSGSAPRPLRVADVNGDCRVNLTDAVYLIRYVFRGGLAPIAGCAY